MRPIIIAAALIISALAANLTFGTALAALPPQVRPETIPYGFLVSGNKITDAPVSSFDRVLHSPGGSQVFTAHTTFAPGFSTGWHTHPGPAIHNVVSGTLTVYAAQANGCTRSAYGPGQGYIDPGYGFLHLGRNEAAVPVDFYVTFLNPAGVDALSIPAPDPGSCVLAALADPWIEQFTATHGRPPTDQDRADRDWSLEFARINGRPPTDDEWRLHALGQL